MCIYLFIYGESLFILFKTGLFSAFLTWFAEAIHIKIDQSHFAHDVDFVLWQEKKAHRAVTW